MTTVSSQQALNSAQFTVTQSTNTETDVFSAHCNTLITTQSYSLAPEGIQAFRYFNPFISTATAVTATLITTTSNKGNPIVNLSGQTNGIIWIEVTNADSADSIAGTLSIAVLVYNK